MKDFNENSELPEGEFSDFSDFSELTGNLSAYANKCLGAHLHDPFPRIG
jgi:hypothetical protein